MELTRRTFVKSTAVALASAAAAGTMAGCSSLAGTGGDAATSGGDSVKTVGVCRFCGCGCGVIVEAKDGKVISVTGDPENGSKPWPELREGLLLGRRAVRRGSPDHPAHP